MIFVIAKAAVKLSNPCEKELKLLVLFHLHKETSST